MFNPDDISAFGFDENGREVPVPPEIIKQVQNALTEAAISSRDELAATMKRDGEMHSRNHAVEIARGMGGNVYDIINNANLIYQFLLDGTVPEQSKDIITEVPR